VDRSAGRRAAGTPLVEAGTPSQLQRIGGEQPADFLDERVERAGDQPSGLALGAEQPGPIFVHPNAARLSASLHPLVAALEVELRARIDVAEPGAEFLAARAAQKRLDNLQFGGQLVRHAPLPRRAPGPSQTRLIPLPPFLFPSEMAEHPVISWLFRTASVEGRTPPRFNAHHRCRRDGRDRRCASGGALPQAGKRQVDPADPLSWGYRRAENVNPSLGCLPGD
jgi:hypothetical protein